MKYELPAPAVELAAGLTYKTKFSGDCTMVPFFNAGQMQAAYQAGRDSVKYEGELPELPMHPEPRTMKWSALEIEAITAGRAVLTNAERVEPAMALTPEDQDRLASEQDQYSPQPAPAMERPQNCGTGYCSCIECLFEPAPQPNIQRLSDDEILAIAHRTATRYTHTDTPGQIVYGFAQHHMIDLAMAIEAAHGIGGAK